MRDYAETRLQMATADYLSGVIRIGKNTTATNIPFPGLMFTHPANESADATQVFWAQRKGQQKGIFDWLFWWQAFDKQNHAFCLHAGAIEHKVGGRPLSPEQKKWQRRFEAIGGRTAITSTVAGTRDVLISWGLECKSMACKEPDISKAEKQRLSMEWQSPTPGNGDL